MVNGDASVHDARRLLAPLQRILLACDNVHGAFAQARGEQINDRMQVLAGHIEALSETSVELGYDYGRIQHGLIRTFNRSVEHIQHGRHDEAVRALWKIRSVIASTMNGSRPGGDGAATENRSGQTHVLLIGSVGIHFVHPLVTHLNETGSFRFSAVGLSNPGGELDDAIAREYEQLFYRPLFFNNPGHVTDLVEHFDLDVYHFHYLHPNVLTPLDYLPEEANVLLSVWGSDLYQLAGVDAYRRQLHAFERADLITLHSVEMREVLLAKFGRHLMPKVRLTLFGQYDAIYETIDRVGDEEVARFRTKHDVDEGKLLVCLGHSAVPRAQHIDMLKAVARLDASLLERITVLLPMTYQKEDGYIRQVRQTIESLELDARMILEYMDFEEVGTLRKCADVFVHVPETDALSSSMCESFYADALVITGMWLPYGRLRKQGLYYREVDGFDHLTHTLTDVLENLHREREKARGNKEKIRDLLDWDRLAQRWKAVYEELS